MFYSDLSVSLSHTGAEAFITKALETFPDENREEEVSSTIQKLDSLLKGSMVQLVGPEVVSKVTSIKALLLQIWHGGNPVLEAQAEGLTAKFYARLRYFVRSYDTSSASWKYGQEAFQLKMMELHTVTTAEDLAIYTTWGTVRSVVKSVLLPVQTA